MYISLYVCMSVVMVMIAITTTTASPGHLKLAQLLLQHHCDMDATDDLGRPALVEATVKGAACGWVSSNVAGKSHIHGSFNGKIIKTTPNSLNNSNFNGKIWENPL